jgi:hypothetical protein
MEFQSRMAEYGAHIRSRSGLEQAAKAAWLQYQRLAEAGACGDTAEATVENLRNIQLCLAHAVYLEAILEQVDSGVGSRGSALTLDEAGTQCHAELGAQWNFLPENPEFREKVLETIYAGEAVSNRWTERRQLPHCDGWFENVWADFRDKKIFEQE